MPTPIKLGHKINQLGKKPRPVLKCYIDHMVNTRIHHWSHKTRSLGDTVDRMATFCITNGFNPETTPSINPPKTK